MVHPGPFRREVRLEHNAARRDGGGPAEQRMQIGLDLGRAGSATGADERKSGGR